MTMGPATFETRSSAERGATAEERLEALARDLSDPTANDDGLLIAFASGPSGEQLSTLIPSLKDRIGVGTAIGLSAAGVVAGPRSFEATDAVSLCLIRGVRVRTVPVDTLPRPEASEPTDAELAETASITGVSGTTAASILLTDPTASPLVRTLPALAGSRPSAAGPLLGGLASGNAVGTGHAIVLNDQPVSTGLLINLEGPLTVDADVSQGARPIGEPMLVTQARENVVLKLGGRPAMERVQETLETLDDADRQLFTSGLLLGLVIDEYRPRFGREDFLIRPVLGLDQGSGAVAIGDRVRTGQTVQFHVRDAAAATDDLSMMLDSAKLREPPPIGALLLTCTSRGGDFFDKPNHDAAMLADCFSGLPIEPGEERAKAGFRIDPAPANAPVAGFFAGGEIGPVGTDRRAYLHTHSAVAALIRPKPTAD